MTDIYDVMAGAIRESMRQERETHAYYTRAGLKGLASYTEGKMAGIRAAASDIARALVAADPLGFDRERFFKACHLWDYLEEEGEYVRRHKQGVSFTGD